MSLSLIFISSVDRTIVTTLISTIGSSLESMQLSSWIGTSYLLSFCMFTPLYGRLANIFGRRPSVLFAGTVFGVGTMLCGFATNMSQLIAFRTIAGIGGGMTIVGSIIVSDSLHQGFANVIFAVGGAIGALIGGWLGVAIGVVFIGQAPFVFFVLFLLYAFVLTVDRSTFSAKLKRIDYLGSASIVLGLLSFLVGNTRAFGDVWPPGAAFSRSESAYSCAAFIAIENHFAAEPVMPLRMPKRNMFLLSIFNFSTIYNTPLYFTATRIRSSTAAGVPLTPFSLTIAFGSVYMGWYMHRTGRYWWIHAFACLTVVVTSVGLACWSAPQGFGFAALLTTAIPALVSSVPKDEIPIATGALFLSRVGVSLSAALTQALLARNLHARIFGAGSAETIAKILASTEYIHTLPPDLQQKAAASWLGAARRVLAAMMFLAALPIEENELPGQTADAAAKSRRPGTPTP
ncbi:MFS general substrate transporter [Mycena pura]|uniref:MFS general substrate transporter n=1 Tax=Mycena pura TaxID=153505 RepID=A0AAD6Y5E2_9AGAR|nr:MFS general substrate transporter [Mycena pura]